MDNENIGFEFVNGSTITSRYEPYQDFRYVDTRTPFDTLDIPTASGRPVRIVYENNSQRGHRASGLVYDEFADLDWLDEFVSCDTGFEIREEYLDRWITPDEYEFTFNGDHFEVKKKTAPDFGEISPSQELNDFVNTLVHGE